EETRLFSKVGFVDAVLSPSFPTFLTFRWTLRPYVIGLDRPLDAGIATYLCTRHDNLSGKERRAGRLPGFTSLLCAAPRCFFCCLLFASGRFFRSAPSGLRPYPAAEHLSWVRMF